MLKIAENALKCSKNVEKWERALGFKKQSLIYVRLS